MSSDEEDYMSENFLSKCVPNNDIRPGLVHNKSVKRQYEMSNKRSEEIEKNKKLRLLNSEEGRRQRGLQEPISSDNKGFSLLQKMGYKPGQGIGKTESGNPEPITIALKTDRFGLGRETVLKEIADWREKKRIQKVQQTEQICDINTYRRRIAEKAQEKQIKADLYSSQKLCEKFDKDKDIQEPEEIWFWPPREEENDDDNNDDEDEDKKEPEIDFEPSEQLKLLTSYLRKCYLYCKWCGTQYEDVDDMQANCPGSTRDDH